MKRRRKRKRRRKVLKPTMRAIAVTKQSAIHSPDRRKCHQKYNRGLATLGEIWRDPVTPMVGPPEVSLQVTLVT